LQPALDLLVEIADSDGRHEPIIAYCQHC
jgi:hypothetical protein